MTEQSYQHSNPGQVEIAGWKDVGDGVCVDQDGQEPLGARDTASTGETSRDVKSSSWLVAGAFTAGEVIPPREQWKIKHVLKIYPLGMVIFLPAVLLEGTPTLLVRSAAVITNCWFYLW